MIWLASFPGSGSAYLSNLLYDAYGLKSRVQNDPSHSPGLDSPGCPVVSTHLMPEHPDFRNPGIQAVCLVRDGRDTLVWAARRNMEIFSRESDFDGKLKAAILTRNESFFGGWSRNVEAWCRRADVLIRFEDLIADPLACIERIRPLLNLPERDPAGSEAQRREAFYPSGKPVLSPASFPENGIGVWKECMSETVHDLFCNHHGETMKRFGYSLAGGFQPLDPDLDHQILKKMGIRERVRSSKPYRVLIEADKLATRDDDGVKRYQVEMLKQFLRVVENRDATWHFDLIVRGRIHPIQTFKTQILSDFSAPTEGMRAGCATLATRKIKRRREMLQQTLDRHFRKLIPRSMTAFLSRHYLGGPDSGYDAIVVVISAGAEMLQTGVYRLLEALSAGYRFFRRLIGANAPPAGDDRFEFAGRRRFDAYDLIHMPLMQHYKPFKRAVPPFVTTIHDFSSRYFPALHTPINRLNCRNGLRFIQKKGSHVIAVSDSTLKDTLRECRIERERVHRVYLAAQTDRFRIETNRDHMDRVLEKYGIPVGCPFFLCLSTIEPRKNADNVLKAYLQLIREDPQCDARLVIAGKPGWNTDEMLLFTRNLPEKILCIGFVDDPDLPAIYSAALCLCYVSFYEGFGLPALEAMRCGTPVVFGANSSLPEIVGGGGLPADPRDVGDIREKLKQLYEDPELRSQKSAAALKQSLQFSWRTAAIETLGVYRRIIETRATR